LTSETFSLLEDSALAEALIAAGALRDVSAIKNAAIAPLAEDSGIR